MNITTSCGENKKEIIEFKSGTLWKEKEYKQIKVNNITLIGKYNFNNMAKNFYGQFFDELEDINKNKITLIEVPSGKLPITTLRIFLTLYNTFNFNSLMT